MSSFNVRVLTRVVRVVLILLINIKLQKDLDLSVLESGFATWYVVSGLRHVHIIETVYRLIKTCMPKQFCLQKRQEIWTCLCKQRTIWENQWVAYQLFWWGSHLHIIWRQRYWYPILKRLWVMELNGRLKTFQKKSLKLSKVPVVHTAGFK